MLEINSTGIFFHVVTYHCFVFESKYFLCQLKWD